MITWRRRDYTIRRINKNTNKKSQIIFYDSTTHNPKEQVIGQMDWWEVFLVNCVFYLQKSTWQVSQSNANLA